MTRRACISVGGVLALLVLWLVTRDNAVPLLGYGHLFAMEGAWCAGCLWGHLSNVKARQEQERHGNPRPDR